MGQVQTSQKMDAFLLKRQLLQGLRMDRDIVIFGIPCQI
jgi:hypothetical protein